MRLDLKKQDKSLKEIKCVSSLETGRANSILLKMNFFIIFARTLPIFLRAFLSVYRGVS